MISKPQGTVNANPVKSFFVHMLTRDIQLDDAILDLLDNCVDGIQRTETKNSLRKLRPYARYWAKIYLSRNEFRIEDNCGGIPWSQHEYAFRLGRVDGKDIDKGLRTIGAYGIGMKRAIFKLGQDCTIETHAKDASYSVRFSEEWMNDEENWDIEAEKLNRTRKRGTSIVVTKLRDAVGKEFCSSRFLNNFSEMLSTHYTYIMGKGFKVYLNGELIQPKKLQLLFAESDKSGLAKLTKRQVEPFIYIANYKGVDIFLAVGFSRPIPSVEEADRSFSNYKEKYSSADAGWTIVCNDRTVVYCDKGPVTGWGVSGVPQYHMQFIAISGIVVFSSESANLLPMTTTKRNIDAQSELYLHVKDKMIEGMKIFTSYTNTWKKKDLAQISREEFQRTHISDLQELQTRASSLKMANTHGVIAGRQYKPELPKPDISSAKQRISFTRPTKDIQRLSRYFFDITDTKASTVGEKCFDVMLDEI